MCAICLPLKMAGYLHFTRARHVDFHPLRLQRQRSDQPGVVCIARPGKGLRAMCAAKNPKSSNGGLWADTGNVIRKIYTDPDISNGVFATFNPSVLQLLVLKQCLLRAETKRSATMDSQRQQRLLSSAVASGIDAPKALANFMAQVEHESGGFQRLEEGFRYTQGIGQITSKVKSALREGPKALEAA